MSSKGSDVSFKVSELSFKRSELSLTPTVYAAFQRVLLLLTLCNAWFETWKTSFNRPPWGAELIPHWLRFA